MACEKLLVGRTRREGRVYIAHVTPEQKKCPRWRVVVEIRIQRYSEHPRSAGLVVAILFWMPRVNQNTQRVRGGQQQSENKSKVGDPQRSVALVVFIVVLFSARDKSCARSCRIKCAGDSTYNYLYVCPTQREDIVMIEKSAMQTIHLPNFENLKEGWVMT